jgi:3-deoxy-7-phosphoheptulonate synthase
LWAVVAADPPSISPRGHSSTPSWSPESWRDSPLDQAPEWPDPAELKEAIAELTRLPPLIDPAEARRLRAALGEVAQRRAIVLQAGDCAESFSDVTAESIRSRLAVILQMAVVLAYGSKMPVVRVGRIAGQFAKPRSSPTERSDNQELPSFRGHMVNNDAWDPAARRPDPARMVLAYHYAAATLNQLRSLTAGGFASLSHIHSWNPEFVATTTEGLRYERTAEEIDRALSFVEATGVQLDMATRGQQTELFTSHEALILDYESALTRHDPHDGGFYDGSAHMLWIGDRTRDKAGAHVEFARGISNPLGIKVGPSARPEDLLELCDVLDPERIPGRLSLITRLGAAQIADLLPPIITAIEESGHPVVWQCDPMHGNTFVSEGRKTRRFDDILSEIRGFFAIHRSLGTWPGGIHVELTGEDVTECLGGVGDISEDTLSLRYTTACDPRLNARQALDLAFKVAELLSD